MTIQVQVTPDLSISVAAPQESFVLIDVSTRKHPDTFTIVDAEDFDRLATRASWRAMRDKGNSLYAVGDAKGNRLERMHRIVLQAPRKILVDHINGHGLDNRKANLRLATYSENLRNARISKRNSTGYKGVSWCKRSEKFVAHICFNGKAKFIGYFRTAQDAALAYDAAALELYGDYAKTNASLKSGGGK